MPVQGSPFAGALAVGSPDGTGERGEAQPGWRRAARAGIGQQRRIHSPHHNPHHGPDHSPAPAPPAPGPEGAGRPGSRPPAAIRLIGLNALSRATPPPTCGDLRVCLRSPNPFGVASFARLMPTSCPSWSTWPDVGPSPVRRPAARAPGRAAHGGPVRARGVGWPAHARPHIKPSAYRRVIQCQRITFAGAGTFAHACACRRLNDRRIHSTNSRHGNRTPGAPETRKPHNGPRNGAENGEKTAEINGADFDESA